MRWHGDDGSSDFLREHVQRGQSSGTVEPARRTSIFRRPNIWISTASTSALQRLPPPRDGTAAYLARLQHIAGPRPLLLAEAGADSLREGPEGQARPHGDAGEGRLRRGRMRRGGVFVDRRLVARGLRSTTGPSGWSIASDARSRSSRRSRAFEDAPFRARTCELAKGVGGGLRVQCRRDHRRLPLLARSLTYPTSSSSWLTMARAMTRPRWLAVTRRPRDRRPQRRPERGTQRGPGGGRDRNGGVYRCRCQRRSGLAHYSSPADDTGLVRVGRTERRAGRRSVDGAVRRAGAWRTDAGDAR